MSSIIRADRWQDSNGVAYNSVLQVVSTTKTDSFSVASTTYTDITGLSVAITPKFATSKILVLANVSGSIVAYVQLVRGSTNICIADAAGSRVRATQSIYTAAGNIPNNSSFSFLDSPSTTSTTTYKIQVRAEAGTVFVNRGSTDTDAGTSFPRTTSTITVMEIAQ